MGAVASGCGSVIGGGMGIFLVAALLIGACILVKRKS
jgi:hypothetical protein